MIAIFIDQSFVSMFLPIVRRCASIPQTILQQEKRYVMPGKCDYKRNQNRSPNILLAALSTIIRSLVCVQSLVQFEMHELRELRAASVT